MRTICAQLRSRTVQNDWFNRLKNGVHRISDGLKIIGIRMGVGAHCEADGAVPEQCLNSLRRHRLLVKKRRRRMPEIVEPD
jgi:hypothetical protein